MNPRATLATAVRVLQQLRRDRRTVALVIGTPVLLMSLMYGIFDGDPAAFQRVGVPLLGVFPLTSMFLVTSVTMLRERTSGTLERLMTLPLAKLDLLLGYALAFGIVAMIQSFVVSSFAFTLLDLQVAGSVWGVVGLAVLDALLGTAFGLFLSAFAQTEFQAVQFMPFFVLPQILLCGLLVPHDSMATVLGWASNALPMTYAYDALERVARPGGTSARLYVDILVLLGATVVALVLGAATLRRRTA